MVATAIMLAQALHDGGQRQLSNGVSHTDSKEPLSLRPPSPPKTAKVTAQGSQSKRTQPARVAQQGAPNSKRTTAEKVAALQPAENAVYKTDTTPAGTADAPAPAVGGGATDAHVRTVQELIAAATAVAETVTASSSAPGAKVDNRSARSEMAPSGSNENKEGGQSGNSDPIVAIIIARPEIKSIDDLRGKIVAIEARHAGTNGNLGTAIAAEGATEVQLSDSPTKAIDRVVNGEVPAAVLTLVSPEAADWFPEIAGYKTFRIPLGQPQLPTRP
jgi:hypothetical protein